MFPRIPFGAQVIISVLCANLSIFSTIGNGSFLAIFARFKNLRNFPNILFANLAVVDFFNALINVPLYVLSACWKISWLEETTWAIISSCLHLQFTLLNVVSMFALMVDRFLALHLDLKYFTWKTNKKARVVVFLTWLVCSILTTLYLICSFDLDLNYLTYAESRRRIFERRRKSMASIFVLLIAASTALGIFTSYTIYQKKKQRIQLNLPRLQAEARQKKDIKATKTVAMAVVTFFVCYIPGIFLAILPRDTIHPWFPFLAAFCTYISSASNPIIYVLRNGRYRAAIRQLVKDPCGSSPFEERPVTNAKRKKKNPQAQAQQLAEEEPVACARPDEDLQLREIGQQKVKCPSLTKPWKTEGQGNEKRSIPKQ